MIKIENVVTPSPEQWKTLILGARNAMNSWEKSDSCISDATQCFICEELKKCPAKDWDKPYLKIGPNDHDLMMRLAKAGTDHRKFMRMIMVYATITAPLYW